MAEPIEITTDQITLGQFLKLANIVESGGMVKLFLKEFAVYINDEQDQRRGRKLKPGDLVEIQGVGSYKVVQSSE
ncbi:S4 domain-containing protein YaaA [Allobacillus sp. GCM10007491]|uniref:S4 domain-containing protein YaaA n=2 Tax=Allobacillus TaxID=1400133 RepID=A0A941CZ32_9BACI|nr:MULTISPECIES: S4 domain-containing protein YaaA [Allobacillus]MBR7554715.1 S4 domain-containing protein YaaA [Allobacillus saliphilus]TSJ63430.1 S4 domain-containing protein YaaA [Allobacillus salarius]